MLGEREFGKNCMEFEVAGGKGKEFGSICENQFHAELWNLRWGQKTRENSLNRH